MVIRFSIKTNMEQYFQQENQIMIQMKSLKMMKKPMIHLYIQQQQMLCRKVAHFLFHHHHQ